MLTLWYYRGGASKRCDIAKPERTRKAALKIDQAGRQSAVYRTKLKYEVSASISSGPRWVATIGIGDPGVE